MKKYIRAFIVFFIASLLFRIVISSFGNHPDIFSNAHWGEWIYFNGPKMFYLNNIWIYEWPTQLPIINLIYAVNFMIFLKLVSIFSLIGKALSSFNLAPSIFKYFFSFIDWFAWQNFETTPLKNGFLMTMKLIPILADMAVAFFIKSIGKKVGREKLGVFLAAVFLIMPCSWYLSALWGQYDQVASLLLVLAFYLLASLMFSMVGWRRRLILMLLSFFLCTLSIQIKPTGLFFIPMFFVLYLMLKPSIVEMFSTSFLFISLNCFSALAFSPDERPIFKFMSEVVAPKIFFEKRFLLSNQAFNLWQGLGTLVSLQIDGIWVKMVVFVIVFILTVLALWVFIRNKQIKMFWIALYILMAGNYLFNIGMMNRYFYTPIVVMGVLSLYYPKIVKYWVLTLIIFTFNLYYSWGYPMAVGIWDVFWKSKFWIFVLSFGNVMIYFLTLKETGCFKHVKKKNN